MLEKPNLGYASEDKNLKEDLYTPNTPTIDPNIQSIRYLCMKFGYTGIIVNRLDYYANAIPLGAFCNSIAFILYGFQRCGVFKTYDTFLWGVVLLFGGIGQITAGLFEFLKGRSFPTTLYLTYGFYCLTHFTAYFIPLKFKDYGIIGINNEKNSLALFFGAWFIISLPIVICSIKTNLLFLIQSACTVLFFFFRWVGEVADNKGYSLRFLVAGIFQVIAGFISLYICISQLINEQARKTLLPTIPFNPENEIDIVEDIQYETPQ